MRVDHSLYSHSDRNAYFTGGVCCYDDGKFGWVEEISDGGRAMVLDEDGNHIRKDFSELSFPKPETGLYQHGRWCEHLTLEPVRQWRKVFRISQYSINIPSAELVRSHVGDLHPRNVMYGDRVKHLFAPRNYPELATAYRMVNSDELLTCAISKHLWIRKDSSGRITVNTVGTRQRRIAFLNQRGQFRSVRPGYVEMLNKLGEVV